MPGALRSFTTWTSRRRTEIGYHELVGAPTIPSPRTVEAAVRRALGRADDATAARTMRMLELLTSELSREDEP
ncbi:MAG TPA: hypothetical protein VN253_11790 [Kofleriaceae bacterium]|nr:hypothetical protein [Kofleriaceae bacterium]